MLNEQLARLAVCLLVRCLCAGLSLDSSLVRLALTSAIILWTEYSVQSWLCRWAARLKQIAIVYSVINTPTDEWPSWAPTSSDLTGLVARIKGLESRVSRETHASCLCNQNLAGSVLLSGLSRCHILNAMKMFLNMDFSYPLPIIPPPTGLGLGTDQVASRFYGSRQSWKPWLALSCIWPTADSTRFQKPQAVGLGTTVSE